MTKKTLILEDFLPYRISVLSNTVSRAIASHYQERFGLSIGEWRAMAVIANAPGLSANEVAQKTAMDKVAVSRAVAKLVKAGRLEKVTTKNDRRRQALALTPAGRRVYAKVVPVARTLETKLLDALSDRDQARLGQLLEKLQKRADEL